MMSETVAGSLVYHLSPDGVDFEPACAPGRRRLRGVAGERSAKPKVGVPNSLPKRSRVEE